MKRQKESQYATDALRIIFLADTHLGLDLPFRPRIQRRRRGPEFFDNFQKVLDDAVELKADCIIHGGDLFYRSKVPPALVEMVFDRLKKVADHGIPIVIVPGNHERSRIPHSEHSFHPNLHIFTRPQTFRLNAKRQALAISGFPFVRENIRDSFNRLMEDTGWRAQPADCHLLCMHQSIQGATVGPGNYTFRTGADVVRIRDIPPEFSAVLSGHIHRFQVLKNGAQERVFYPGAIDRVSFAERNETKGYLRFIIAPPATDTGQPSLSWNFHRLPSRPMATVDIRPGFMGKKALADLITGELEALDADAIVRIKLNGRVTSEQWEVLSAKSIRALAKPTMNVNIALYDQG